MTRTGPGCPCGCGGHDERRAPAPPYNPPGRTALDNRVGEYGSFRAAMLDRLASPAYPALRELTVRTPDDPAIGLLDGWAVLADLLTFHSERIADEGYLRTATEHRSLALLGRLVGHRPRPAVAAATHLAYTVDRDPGGDEDPGVLIPRGSRSHSVPAAAGEDAQTFETDDDLLARAAWNELAVRRRRPTLLVPEDLTARSEIQVAGTATGVRPGDRLLFVFDGGRRLLHPVAGVRTDRAEDLTALTLPASAPPTLGELVEELRQWITEPDPHHEEDPAPTPENPNPRPVGPFTAEFDAQVLAPLRAELDTLTSPAAFVARLAGPLERLAEAQALTAAAEHVAAWFARLAAVLAELRERAAELGPVPVPGGAAGTLPVETGPGAAALAALDGPLPALRARTGRTRPVPAAPDAGRLFAAGSDLGARLLAAADPRVADGLYTAWRHAAVPAAAVPPAPVPAAGGGPGAPEALRELLALRVTAAPFGATAPLRPVQDERGRVVEQADWPLTGAALTTVRLVLDPAGRRPVRAEFLHSHAGRSAQRVENLPAETAFDLGPGRIELGPAPAGEPATDEGTAPDEAAGDRRADRPAAPAGASAQDPEQASARAPEQDPPRERAAPGEPGVAVRMLAALPERTLTVSRPGEDGRVEITVRDGGEPERLILAPGERRQFSHGEFVVTARHAGRSEPAAVEIGLASVPPPEGRAVLPLDTVHEGVTVGSHVVVRRPRKGETGRPDGIPGDPALAFVTTRVTAVRTAAYAAFGITGRGTELTLADPWLDEHDTLLSHIRDATVHAAGEPLRPAGEPIAEEVYGNGIELAELYEGLRPGRLLVVTGERSDVPRTSAVPGTELAVIAAVEQTADPRLPGDHVHTRLTLTADLVHRYRRETVRVLGNVVAAGHGESRDEAIGSGDADRTGQTFTLWRAPLTWRPAALPPGAEPELEVRVDGLLWRRVRGLAGHGPTDRVYVLGTDGAGRPTIAFGDGVHGARLPTGHENVRARYRFGAGAAGNLPAGRITQAVTRPLGVTGVTNPLPATGGADPDGPELTRAAVPLAVSVLDRLVSLKDYEDFARSRAGIGRASAREVFDGRCRVLQLTVAGSDDLPLDGDGEVVRALRAALAEYGDTRLPVRVDVRERVLLLIAARVAVAPGHAWHLVESRLRAALLARLGFAGRDLARPARLSEVLAAAHTVPGVDRIDVDAFTGVPGSVTAAGLAGLAGELDGPPRDTVPARPARFEERRHRVDDPDGESLSGIAARHGLPLAELLRLNPDITDTRRLPYGRTVLVFRGLRPAQLALLAPEADGTLILTEVHQ